MTRRYTPSSDGSDGLAAVLAGRVDALERQLTDVQGDVAAVGRGVTDLTTQIRHLTGSQPGGDDPADLDDTDEDGEAAEDGEEGQLDWFAVTDPGQAEGIVTALTTWTETVLAHYGITPPPPCWPLHPAVVADLIALDAERAAAYSGPQPTPVSEFLGRWLPATRDRIRDALTDCLTHRCHREGGRDYDTTGFDPLSAAAWWATDRKTPAPQAFTLAELT